MHVTAVCQFATPEQYFADDDGTADRSELRGGLFLAAALEVQTAALLKAVSDICSF